MGSCFLSPAFTTMGERALLPHLIYFRHCKYKQAHPLVKCAAGNHGYWHNAPRQEFGDINLLYKPTQPTYIRSIKASKLS